MDKDKFIQKAKEVHGDKYDYSSVPDVFDTQDKVKIRCKLHGDFMQKASNHVHLRHNCPECGKLQQKKSRLVAPAKDFSEKVKSVHGDKYDISESIYNGQNSEITVVCRLHGEFSIKPKSLLKGCGCKRCSAQKMRDKFKLPYSEFKNRFSELHGTDLRIVGELTYDNLHGKIEVSCKFHGNFKARGLNLIKGHGCPSCNLTGFNPKKPAYFYVNLVGEQYLKLGVTNNVEVRTKNQDRKCKFPITNIFHILLEYGSTAKELEQRVMSNINCGVLSKEDMEDGYTETINLKDLDKVYDIIFDFFTNDTS